MGSRVQGTRALEVEGDGPPLLLLHGYSDSADTWRLLLDRLARAGRLFLAQHLHDRETIAHSQAVDDYMAHMFAYPGRTFGQLYRVLPGELARRRAGGAPRP